MTNLDWTPYAVLQELTEGGQVHTNSGGAVPIDLASVHLRGLELVRNPPEEINWYYVLRSIIVDSLRKYKREVMWEEQEDSVDIENLISTRDEIDRLISEWNRRATRTTKYGPIDLGEAVEYETTGHVKKDNAIRNRLYRFRKAL